MLIINLTVIEIVIKTMFTYPWKNDQKSHGWQFTAEVNYPLSRQFLQTVCYYFYILWSIFQVILTTEEVTATTLKDISATTKVILKLKKWSQPLKNETTTKGILTTKEVNAFTLKNISATTKVISVPE